MRNIKLTIEYDGTNYQGWQRQRNTRQTIQETIEVALEQILQERIRLIASGRTDAGVHARAQVASFKTDKNISSRKLKQALNSLVGDDIVITNVKDMDLGFHARFDIKSKTYRYAILNQRHPSVFWRNFAYFVPYKLDLKLMRRAASVIVGRHNFSSFQATDKRPRRSIRVIKEIKITKKRQLIFIDIKADGFLYKMARNIIGTLIEIGRRKQSPIDIKKILAKRDRKFAGPTVPAHGLCLLRVEY